MGVAHTFLVVLFSVLVCSTLQQDDNRECDLTTHVRRSGEEVTLNSKDGCTEGRINWHYPQRNLRLNITRASFRDLQVDAVKLHVCLSGDVTEAEDISGIDHHYHFTTRRGRERELVLPLDVGADESAEETTFCTCCILNADGFVLELKGPASMIRYMNIFRYKVQICEGSECDGMRGNRRGQGGRRRGQGGRGGRGRGQGGRGRGQGGRGRGGRGRGQGGNRRGRPDTVIDPDVQGN